MDPNNVVGTPSAQPQPAPTAAATISAELAAAPAPASQPEPNPMTMGPKKSSKGGIIAAILFALIAAGGVGFGVWAMMDGKTKEEQYNTQIDALKKTNSELMEKLSEGGDDSSDGYLNPIISSGDEGVTYSMSFESSYIGGQGSTKRVGIRVENGSIIDCSFHERQDDGSWKLSDQCSINGLSEGIYKVIEFGEGQENSGNKIGFIMEDGRVAYFGLYDFASSNSVDIDNYLNINNVVDALTIGVHSGGGGFGSTIFVMSDGSYIKFSDSMLN